MKKYLFEILFYFFLPISLIAAISEYSIRKIPNDYAYKNNWLEENSQNLKILCLGPSSIFYNINPEYFSSKAFNGAHVSQSLKYDYFIFNKFVDQMDSLKYLILGIDIWSPVGSLEDGPEWWRVKYYSIHYGNNYHKGEMKYNYELYFHDRGTFVNAAKGFLTLLGLRNESHMTINQLGYGKNYLLENRPAKWDNGLQEAKRYNELLNKSDGQNEIEENRRYIADICRTSAEKGIQVLLVNLPLYKSYLENLEPRFVKERKDFCNSFAREFENVTYLDFTTDNRFTEDDFYDSIHLNEIGAKKITQILDSILMNPE